MLFETMLMLSTNPDKVASTYQAASEIWDDIFATEFNKIVEEETEDYINKSETMDLEDHLDIHLDIMVGDRLAKVLTERQEEFKKKVGLGLYEDVFASLGFLRFYKKYSHDVNRMETSFLIRGFRRSDCRLSIQHKAEKFWEFVSYRNCYGDQGMINLMVETILMLSKDPYKVAEAYKAGSKIWGDIYSSDYSKIYREETNKMMESYAKSYKTRMSERMAEILPAREAEFKKQCGDGLYAEVMAVLGVLFFYDAQHGLTGEAGAGGARFLKAIRLSNCSETVKDKFEGFYKRARKG
ncbi:hypothetical protein [Oceanobacillus sp. Castelsardo]|uniref:hypothetical protein n=1 Tax=Oceanobacillus sp. Castelsardo TaxID=1851204 RepID=UPI0008387110|nr:hypothetical protein [Oceanobacillus sp. Castelsardo]